MNSISSTAKFDQLKLLVQGNVDILVITVGKLDESLPLISFRLMEFLCLTD